MEFMMPIELCIIYLSIGLIEEILKLVYMASVLGSTIYSVGEFEQII